MAISKVQIEKTVVRPMKFGFEHNVSSWRSNAIFYLGISKPDAEIFNASFTA